MCAALAFHIFLLAAYAASVRTLAAGCCPGCGYELADLPTDDD